MEDRRRIYTDGACSGNPGPGGWAWASSKDHGASGGEPATTNNRMELTAVLRAVADNPGLITVVMDSTYVKDGIQKWSQAWRRNGWMTKAREPVKNRDLWEPLVDLIDARGPEVELAWVKGHSGDPMNDLVDAMAVVERDRFRANGGPVGVLDGRGPTAAPGAARLADLAPGERRAERRRRDGRIPEGHLLVVVGLPPDGLGGWEDNPVADDVRRRLGEWIAAQRQVEPDLVVVTGMRPGAEMLAAEAAEAVGVRFVALIAFPDQDRNLSGASRARFAAMRAKADREIAFEKKSPRSSDDFRKAMARRDAWLAQIADQAVLVWDERDDRLDRLHADLVKVLGDDLLVLSP